MDELNHLANKFKSRLNFNQNRADSQTWSQNSGPPHQQNAMPMPYQQPPVYNYQQSPNYGGPGQFTDAYPYPTSPASAGGSRPAIPPRPSGQPQGPPALAPRPSPSPQASSASRAPIPSNRPSAPQAGAIYTPGTYPTPELPLYPITKSRVLNPSSPEEFTSKTIQDALNEMGPSSTIYLPAGSVWNIESPIILEDYQEIATIGYPSSAEQMAVLDAHEGCRPHLIHAFDKSGIRIRNLIIEGGKEKYGWDKEGGVMIQLGGGKAHNQVLDSCIIRNPRHWSCVQAFEGAHNVRITNNAIGPAGVGCDVKELNWADGISYAASDGLVAGNLIIDTTDGGIVLFNAPGTLVTSNTVVTRTRLGLGAINMVDFIVYDGDYTFTRVTHNTIVTAGSLLKIGIGQGCSVWGQQSKRQISHGGTVSHNLITRDTSKIAHTSSSYALETSQPGNGTIGYGFPVGSDITDWTCIDNVSEEGVRYEGDISKTLPGFLNASPGPFVHDRFGNAEGDEADMSKLRLQSEFVSGKIWGLLDVQEGPSKVLAYDGGGLKLRRGEKLQLHGSHVVFRDDAELCVYRDNDRQLLWEAGVRSLLDPRHNLDNALLQFLPGGKLVIVDANDPQNPMLDLTPHVPANLPSSDSNRPTSPRLVLSSETPYLTITSAKGNLLYGSSYSLGRFCEFKVGKYVSRPTPHVPGGGSLVWTLSPQRQFVVVHTRVELPQRVDWPIDMNICQIVCTIGDGNTDGVDDPEARMGLQGDGHLVIVDGKGDAVWGSGTCGDRGAFNMLFGLGTPEEPYLELVNAEGQRLWST